MLMKKIAYTFVFVLIFPLLLISQTKTLLTSPKSDVFMQGFYWNSPPGGTWYDSLAKLAPRLASAGFSAIWFPSPVKGSGGALSMGYDPYDHYDFGDYQQKGSKKTRFGNQAELQNAIRVFRDAGVQVFADAILRHMMGAEQLAPYECIPKNNGVNIVPDSSWLIYQYPNGSGRFKKDAGSFYPNSTDCWVDPLFVDTDPIFRFGEWLDHNKPSVRDSLIEWGKYLKNTIGFDGFRLDAVKAIDPAFMAAWLKGANGTGYAVEEDWSSTSDIQSLLNNCHNIGGANVSMFDFPLRYTLKDMCNNTSGTFDMNNLDGAGLVNAGTSGYYVATFAENHDFDRTGWDGKTDTGNDPIISDKHLAYGYMLFSEGRPCVFFKDYFEYGLSGKIDTLMWIRQKFLGGGTTKRGGLNPYYIKQDGSTDQTSLSQDIYVARRDGYGTQPGGYIVINDNPTQWIDVWVDTDAPAGSKFKDYTGHDTYKLVYGPTGGDTHNRVKLWAPPRNYTIYANDTTQIVNDPPVVNKIADLTGYTNSEFSFQVQASDANNDSLIYQLSGNPAWLSITNKGILKGTPTFSDTAVSNIVLKVSDRTGAFDADTFKVSVKLNHSPVLALLKDTTIYVAKRFQLQLKGTDPDAGDSLVYSLNNAPAFINIGSATGIVSGTPSISDTGSYPIKFLVTDGKGGYDSTGFVLKVIKKDSIIATYDKPKLDGIVNVGSDDWLVNWRIAWDPDTNSYWNTNGVLMNEIWGLYSTWDADSLYFGVNYIVNDVNNTLMLYIDAGLANGITNFNSTQGYNGDYPKNIKFPAEHGINFFTAAYYHTAPSLYKVSGNTSVDLSSKINAQRGPGGKDSEFSIAWNDLFGLGAGLVPPHLNIYAAAVLAGGSNWGGGDALPRNPSVIGTVGPDTILNFAVISPDSNGDGIPDPTIFITVSAQDKYVTLPDKYILNQNYPNPFNPSTTITYELPSESRIVMAIYDILGRQVKTLVNETRKAGKYSLKFDASGLPSGIYFIRLSANAYVEVKKMVLLK